MPTFKQYFSEKPIDDDEKGSDFKNAVNQVIEKFSRAYPKDRATLRETLSEITSCVYRYGNLKNEPGANTELGLGSERRVYRIEVAPKTIEAFGDMIDIPGSSTNTGTVITVLKVAKDEMAMKTNKYEFDTFQENKGQEFLLPMIDHSTNILGANPLDEGRGYMFIQTALCDVDPVSIQNAITKDFGNLFLLTDQFTRVNDLEWKINMTIGPLLAGSRGKQAKTTIPLFETVFKANPNVKKATTSKKRIELIDARLPQLDDSVDFKEKEVLKFLKTVTDKQFKNIIGFMRISKKIKVNDLHSGNMGVYRRRFVIIDYSYSTNI